MSCPDEEVQPEGVLEGAPGPDTGGQLEKDGKAQLLELFFQKGRHALGAGYQDLVFLEFR